MKDIPKITNYTNQLTKQDRRDLQRRLEAAQLKNIRDNLAEFGERANAVFGPKIIERCANLGLSSIYLTGELIVNPRKISLSDKGTSVHESAYSMRFINAKPDTLRSELNQIRSAIKLSPKRVQTVMKANRLEHEIVDCRPRIGFVNLSTWSPEDVANTIEYFTILIVSLIQAVLLANQAYQQYLKSVKIQTAANELRRRFAPNITQNNSNLPVNAVEAREIANEILAVKNEIDTILLSCNLKVNFFHDPISKTPGQQILSCDFQNNPVRYSSHENSKVFSSLPR